MSIFLNPFFFFFNSCSSKEWTPRFPSECVLWALLIPPSCDRTSPALGTPVSSPSLTAALPLLRRAPLESCCFFLLKTQLWNTTPLDTEHCGAIMCVISKDTHARPFPKEHAARAVHSHSFFLAFTCPFGDSYHRWENFLSIKYFPFANDAQKASFPALACLRYGLHGLKTHMLFLLRANHTLAHTSHPTAAQNQEAAHLELTLLFPSCNRLELILSATEIYFNYWNSGSLCPLKYALQHKYTSISHTCGWELQSTLPSLVCRNPHGETYMDQINIIWRASSLMASTPSEHFLMGGQWNSGIFNDKCEPMHCYIHGNIQQDGKKWVHYTQIANYNMWINNLRIYAQGPNGVLLKQAPDSSKYL